MSSERTAVKALHWNEFAPGQDLEGETKNFKVPPELIELARANGARRGSRGTLTPLAPKPTDDVAVVVPPAAALVTPEEYSGLLDLSVVAPLRSDVAPRAALARGFGADSEEAEGCVSEPLPLISSAERAARREAEAGPASRVSPTRALAPYFTGAAIVSAYVGLCYLANTLIAALP